jgi:APA family basic amino acid/polyamine antiporter
MFLCAKTASAATAALGFAGYALQAAGADGDRWLVPLAVLGVGILTLVAAAGIRRSNQTNAAIVSITIAALVTFVITGLSSVFGRAENFQPFFGGAGDRRSGAGAFFEATALMFVAYTGYGRIATLGEEVREPRSTIPKAIVTTLVVSAAIYGSVAAVAVGTAGAARLAAAVQGDAAPLAAIAREFGGRWVAWAVGAGAITAMLGVLLNLILGLSRVLLAMARRGDMPRVFARLNRSETTPYAAVVGVGVAIALVAALGSVKAAWSFSAFTVLVYYGITNLAAIALPRERRLYSVWVAWAGLLSCLGLAFWVEMRIWMVGVGLLGLGLVWHAFVDKENC